VNVERPAEGELLGEARVNSETARERVREARERQSRRLRGTSAGSNGELDAKLTRAFVVPDERASLALGRAYATGALSARGRHRVLRVARTIADLEGRDRVLEADVLLALSLRRRSASSDAMAA
jgi:magnesium chelatase family protein